MYVAKLNSVKHVVLFQPTISKIWKWKEILKYCGFQGTAYCSTIIPCYVCRQIIRESRSIRATRFPRDMAFSHAERCAALCQKRGGFRCIYTRASFAFLNFQLLGGRLRGRIAFVNHSWNICRARKESSHFHLILWFAASWISIDLELEIKIGKFWLQFYLWHVYFVIKN